MVKKTEVKRYIRPFHEAREIMLERARQKRNPVTGTKLEDITSAFSTLKSLDPEEWAKAFSDAAEPYEEMAKEAEARGDGALAKENYLLAYATYRIARYPAPNSPAKRRAYTRSKTNWLKASRYFEIVLEPVEIPFPDPNGEDKVISGYLYRAPGDGPRPAVVCWGGIDGYKEDRQPEPFVKNDLDLLAIDMPGVADAPINGSQNTQGYFDTIFKWIGMQPNVDSARLAASGSSTGGYWAAKVAHTHRDVLKAVVNHGGPVHYAFQPEWIEKSQSGEYPFELAETLASAFGLGTFDDWVQSARNLSLLDEGLLDEPSAPLLCVNGIDDSVFPIRDHYLLLEHGTPKCARFYPGGHMGPPAAREASIQWMADVLHGR